jgi:excisionase family DNA binding protein
MTSDLRGRAGDEGKYGRKAAHPALRALTSKYNQGESAQAAAERHLVKKSDIARRYSVSPRTVQTWVAQRRIPYVRIGNTLRFNPRACDQALARFGIKELALSETRVKRRAKAEAGT